MAAFPSLLSSQINTAEEDSFWPSFTDLMMVVLMIFLISTTFLIIRNSNLVQELTRTMEAELIASQQVETTLAENMSLEERVAALEQLLARSQLQNMRYREDKLSSDKRIVLMEQEIEQQKNVNTKLESELSIRESNLNVLTDRLANLSRNLNDLQRIADEREDMINENVSRLSALNKSLQQLEVQRALDIKVIETAKTRQNLTKEDLEQLRLEYAQLQSKYDKLVRPARTTKGKFVVSVRYEKKRGKDLFQLKLAGENSFTTISENDMHQRLSKLKETKGKDLYIRIIFPENNTLSYKEAWRFTNDILSKYDYYQQAQ